MYRRFPSKGSTSFLRLPRFPWRRFPQGFQVKVPEKRFSSKGSYTVLKVPKGTSYMLPQGSQVKVPTRLPRFGYVFAVSPIFYISCFLPFARLVGGICQSCFLAVGDILLGLFFRGVDYSYFQYLLVWNMTEFFRILEITIPCDYVFQRG